MSLLLTSLTVALCAAAAPPAPGLPSPPVDAASLVRDADRARGGLTEGITWTVEVTSTEDGSATTTAYLVRARGDDALAEVTAPAHAKGEKLLFSGGALWFIKPGLKKPVAVSTRQKLAGPAAAGDVASTNYARDYAAELVGEDDVGGAAAWRLELKATGPSATYDRIRYWVAKSGRRALKAEFLTVGGDVVKTATFEYGNKLTVAGKALELISRMTITDAMGEGAVSVVRFGAPRAEAHPASTFTLESAVR